MTLLHQTCMLIVVFCCCGKVTAQFTTIVNLPPDQLSTPVESDTQLNIWDSAHLPTEMRIDPGVTATNVEVNLAGGEFAGWDVSNVSSFNVSGGEIIAPDRGHHFALDLHNIGTVNLSGGTFANNISISDSNVNVTGGLFERTIGEASSPIGINISLYNNSTMNVHGGELNHALSVSRNSVVNVYGGQLGSVTVYSEGDLNIHGGSIDYLDISGREVTIDGGTFGRVVGSKNPNSEPWGVTRFIGSDFRINGALVAGLETDGDEFVFTNTAGGLTNHQVLTGALADGTPFVFGGVRDRDFPGRATGQSFILEQRALPPTERPRIVASMDPVPLGIRDGQVLVVDKGGVVTSNFNLGPGSALHVEGGVVGRNLEAMRAEVLISGGNIGSQFDAFAGTNVRMSGGSIGDRIFVEEGAEFTVVGDEFRLNGVPIDGLTEVGSRQGVDLGSGDLLVGTLTDGTPLVLCNCHEHHFPLLPPPPDFGEYNLFAEGTLVLELGEIAPSADPDRIIVAAEESVPVGIRRGQTLIIDEGSTVDDNLMASPGSTVEIRSGTVGRNFEAVGANVTISGGNVEAGFSAFEGTQVVVTGGSLADIEIYDGSEASISGGDVGTFRVLDGGRLELIGRQFRSNRFGYGSQLVQPGESIVYDGNELYGRLLDGALISGFISSGITLTGGFSRQLNRGINGTLLLTVPPHICDFDANGVCDLGDLDLLFAQIGVMESMGSEYDQVGGTGVDLEDVDAWLNKAGFTYGDANLDGAIDQYDLNILGQNWLDEVPSWGLGDFNGDNRVDALDLNKIGENWLHGTVRGAAVPEPGCCVILWLTVWVWITRR